MNVIAGELAHDLNSALLHIVGNDSVDLSNPVTQFAVKVGSKVLQNDFISAGLIIGILTFVFTLLRSIINRAYHFFLSYYTVSITIASREDSYDWLKMYLTKRRAMVKAARHFNVQAVYRDQDRYEDYEKDNFPDIAVIPASGTHVLNFKGHRISFYLKRKNSQMNPSDYLDEMTFSMYGRNPAILQDLVQEAYKEYYYEREGQTHLFRSDEHRNSWRRISSRGSRPLESVLLPDGVSDQLYSDITRFLSREKWYRERGIPYRRGYLLYGPPGCGKTSFICALAGRLHLNVCILSLSGRSMNDAVLIDLMNSVPRHSLILLEDVDACFVETKNAEDNCSRVSFSGLLNAIDGAAAQEGAILFMTTNYIERLAPALIRPGRVDKRILFERATRSQLRRAFLSFFAAQDDAAEQFAACIPERTVSMAQVQSYLLCYADDLPGALHNTQELLELMKTEQAEQEMLAAAAAGAAPEDEKKDEKKSDEVAPAAPAAVSAADDDSSSAAADVADASTSTDDIAVADAVVGKMLTPQLALDPPVAITYADAAVQA